MAFLSKIFAPKYKKIIAKGMEKGEYITLETNTFTTGNQQITKQPSCDDVMAALSSFFSDEDAFVILTLPSAPHRVRYIQCAHDPSGKTEVQIGIEVKKGIKLLYNLLDARKTERVFEKFYKTGKVDGIGKYKPVLFEVR